MMGGCLGRAFELVARMAGFGSGALSDPVIGVGDFESDPVCGLVAGFELPAYFRTVARSSPNSRAMRRLDQPCLIRVRIDCC